ncbi:MAG TPA: aromatic amino acid lyase, partial [Ferruginibacter sp.]|nr:aromatic amino acid lyase [Ferruginibacter sp.]
MNNDHFPLDKEPTDFLQVKNLLALQQPVSIAADALERISKCRKYLDEKMDSSDALFYGINTGFGFLQHVQIDKSQLQELQRNLIKSHACGMGEEVPADIVKLMIAFKIKSLSYGYS